MKAMGKRFGSTRKSGHEKEKLIKPSEQPTYQTQVSTGSNAPSTPRSRRSHNTSTSSEKSLSPPVRQGNEQFHLEPIKIGFSHEHNAMSTEVKAPIPTPPAVEPISRLDIDFDLVPFQIYSRKTESWSLALVQAAGLLFALLLVPSIFFLFAMIVHHFVSKYKKRKSKRDQRRFLAIILNVIVCALIKDLIIFAIVLHAVYKGPTSNYGIAYAPVFFIWFLICFVCPLFAFYTAESDYEFGNVSAIKGTFFRALPCLSAKANTEFAKKEEKIDKEMKDKYTGLLSITGPMLELEFLNIATSKMLRIVSFLTILIVCMVHCLFPTIIAFLNCPPCLGINATYIRNGTNVSSSNVTHAKNGTDLPLPDGMYIVIITVAGVNSMMVSLVMAAFVAMTIFWKVAILEEWKHFNKLESDSNTTLILHGPSGIAMWWKVRQLLLFLTESSECMSNFLGHMACGVATAFITCATMFIMYNSRSSVPPIDPEYDLLLLLIDMVLLYIAIIIQFTIGYLCHRQKNVSTDLLVQKQLNISFEVGKLMNLDSETLQQEPQAREKVRLLRGCLMLLQELAPAVQKLAIRSCSTMSLVYVIISTVCILASIVSSMDTLETLSLF